MPSKIVCRFAQFPHTSRPGLRRDCRSLHGRASMNVAVRETRPLRDSPDRAGMERHRERCWSRHGPARLAHAAAERGESRFVGAVI